VKPIGNGSAEQ